MTASSDNSHPVDPPRRSPADYLYQGATILAALLLVISAAI